jgi:hypothetical protein
MCRLVLSLIIFTSSVVAFAQSSGQATKESASRAELLKGMVARDRGEITAIEPSSKEAGGVIVGYSSGAVLNCFGRQSCREFSGTPSAAVEHIAVSRRGASEIFWVTYQHGALYQCADTSCSKFKWQGP